MESSAKVGGILSIISGAFGVFWLVWIFFMFFIMRIIPNESLYPNATEMPAEFFRMMTIFYSVIGGFFVILGILAIIGGIFALKRRKWGLALTGAIAGTLTFFPCGIPAIIFVSMARQEFVSPKPPATVV